MRRRQRRLRSWWRHEQQSIAAALATALHHSAQRPVPKKQEWEDAEYVASRGQKTDTRAHGGLRPALLAEPHGVEQVLRHTVDQIVVAVPLVPLLDDPVPQTVDTVLEFWSSLDLPVDEQVIAVPKISFDCVSQLPQIVDQLVEVPTVLTKTRIALQIAEQIAGIPVPRGCGEQRLQGLLPGQGSTSVSSAERISERTVEQIVDIPGGGLPGFSHGQGSTSVSSAERISERTVEQIIEYSSVEVFKVSLPDRVQQRFVEQNTLTFQFLSVVEGWAMEVFTASPRDRAQQRFVKQNTSTFQFLIVVEDPWDRAQQRFLEQNTLTFQFFTVVEGWAVEVFTASPRDRAPQRFVEQNTSTFQFLTVVESWVVEVFMLFKVFYVDRVQQLTFPQNRVHQRLRSRMSIARLLLSVPVAHGVRVSRTSTFQCLACDQILVELMLVDVLLAGSSLSLAPEVAASSRPARVTISVSLSRSMTAIPQAWLWFSGSGWGLTVSWKPTTSCSERGSSWSRRLSRSHSCSSCSFHSCSILPGGRCPWCNSCLSFGSQQVLLTTMVRLRCVLGIKPSADELREVLSHCHFGSGFRPTAPLCCICHSDPPFVTWAALVIDKNSAVFA